MSNQKNIIEAIIDGSIVAVTTGISLKYPELAGVMGAITGAATVLGMEKIRCLIAEISGRVEGMRKDNVPMDYLSSPQFIQDIQRLLYEKSLEDLEQKRLLYGNYFESCCRRFSTEKQNLQRYYVLLKDLDLIEFAILKLLPANEVTRYTANKIYESCSLQFDTLTLDDLIMRLESLETKSLIKQISSREVEEKYLRRFGNIRSRTEQMCYYKTTTASKLLQFIALS